MFVEAQKAIYDELASLTPPVYDHVPQGAAFPYIVIADMNYAEWDTDLDIALSIDTMIHVWTRGPQGKKQAKEIQWAIYEKLHRATIEEFIKCECEYSDCFPDPDGLTYHGVQKFNIITKKDT